MNLQCQSHQVKTIYGVDLTLRQHNFLQGFLPRGYSFQKMNESQAFLKRKLGRPPSRKNSTPIKSTSKSEQSSFRTLQKARSNSMTNLRETSLQPQFLDPQLKVCFRILNFLKNSVSSWPFREPVNPIADGIPNYPDVIDDPMDLQTIQKKLNQNIYKTATQFHADVHKIIRNSYIFNHLNQPFIKLTKVFEKYYFGLIPHTKLQSQSIKYYKRDEESPVSILRKSKSKSNSNSSIKKRGRVIKKKKPMVTTLQKQALCKKLRTMKEIDLKELVKTVFEENNELSDVLDLDLISQQKFREIEQYVRNKSQPQSQGLNSKTLTLHLDPSVEKEESSYVAESDS